MSRAGLDDFLYLWSTLSQNWRPMSTRRKVQSLIPQPARGDERGRRVMAIELGRCRGVSIWRESPPGKRVFVHYRGPSWSTPSKASPTHPNQIIQHNYSVFTTHTWGSPIAPTMCPTSMAPPPLPPSRYPPHLPSGSRQPDPAPGQSSRRQGEYCSPRPTVFFTPQTLRVASHGDAQRPLHDSSLRVARTDLYRPTTQQPTVQPAGVGLDLDLDVDPPHPCPPTPPERHPRV